MANATETKTPRAIECEIDDNLGGLTLTFSNGSTLRLETSQLTPTIGAYALMHGLKQKLVDAAAISRNPETGSSATIDDKYNAVREVFDRLLAGEWNKTREGGGGGGSLLFKALCRMYPNKSAEDVRAYLDGKNKAEQAALRGNPRVAAIIEEIRVETGKDSGVDTDAMLDELGGE